MKNWEAMNPRERDAAVAQAMGWTNLRWIPGLLLGTPKGREQEVPVPHYTTDFGCINVLARELKAKVNEIVIHIERDRTWLEIDSEGPIASVDSIPELLSLGLLIVKGEQV